MFIDFDDETLLYLVLVTGLFWALVFGGGYYYIFYGSRFDYRFRKAESVQNISLDSMETSQSQTKKSDRPYTVKLSELNLSSTENKISLQLSSPFYRSVIDQSGKFLHPLATFKTAKLLTNNSADRVTDRNLRLNSKPPYIGLNEITSKLLVGFDTGISVTTVGGVKGEIVVEELLRLKKFSIPVEDGKYSFELGNERVNTEVQGRNVFFPDIRSLKQTVYIEGRTSQEENIEVDYLLDLPETFNEQRSYLQTILYLFFYDSHVNVHFEKPPEILTLYKATDAKKQHISFDIRFDAFGVTVDDFDDTKIVNLPSGQLTVEPIRGIDSGTDSVTTGVENLNYKWQVKIDRPLEAKMDARFFDARGRTVEVIVSGRSVSIGAKDKRYWKLHEKPDKAVLRLLRTRRKEVKIR